MARLVTQVGAITVVIKDDRAELDKPTLKAWKAASLEIVEAAVANLVEAVGEDEDG